MTFSITFIVSYKDMVAIFGFKWFSSGEFGNNANEFLFVKSSLACKFQVL